MVGAAGSLTRYPEFHGRGYEYVEQHWYLCEAIWRARGTPETSKVVEFKTTLRDRALKWYMKSVDPQAGRIPSVADVKKLFIEELKLPQSEQQGIAEIRDIKQLQG